MCNHCVIDRHWFTCYVISVLLHRYLLQTIVKSLYGCYVIVVALSILKFVALVLLCDTLVCGSPSCGPNLREKGEAGLSFLCSGMGVM
jgi:hypothetical protein